MRRHLATRTFFLAMLSAGLALAGAPAQAQTGTVIASDDFNRADETPFAVGDNWGKVTAGNYPGNSQLVGAQVSNGPNEGIYYWQGAGTFDPTRQFARERVVQKDGELGLVLLGGPNQAIMINWGPPGPTKNIYIYWYAAGADQGVLSVTPSSLNNGDIVEASLENGIISAKVNGVVIASVANTTTLTTGSPGFITYGDPGQPALVGILDDWEGGLPTTPTTAALTVTTAHGTVTRNPDQPEYAFGTQVTLTPVPDEGYVFADWSGDVPAGHTSDNPLVLTMDQDRSLTARFESLNPVAADDFNRADETPLTLGGNWQRPFSGGTANLANHQVAGAAGEALYFWQGAGTFDNAKQFSRATVAQAGGQVGLVLLGSAGRAIVASWTGGSVYVYWYSGGTYQANLVTAPSTLQNGDVIEAFWDAGTIYAMVNGAVVTSVSNTTGLAAGRPGFETFQAGGALDDWGGGSTQSYEISGTITENAVGLAGVHVSASGGFTGSVTSDADGAYVLTGVPPGATGIVLTPTLAGHTLSPATRTVSGPVSANVTGLDFTSTPVTTATLTVLANDGSVTKDPDLSPYPIGTDVTLTPVPDEGFVFADWGGDVPAGHATDNPLVVTMDHDRSLTARFESTNLVASDDFNRADETPLTLGGNWQRPFAGGTANLANQQVVGAAGEALYYWQGPGAFDNTLQLSRATVASAGGQVGLVLLGSAGRAIVASWTGGSVYVYWYSGGTYQANLVTAPSTLHDGDVIEALLDAGTIYAKVNGAVVASAANTTALPAGRPGFETFQAGGALDDWKAGTTPSHAIGGTITENAAGLAGVLVSASGGFSGSATSDANGAYVLTGVPPGATGIVLTPTLAGHALSPATRTVSGPVTANVTGVDFTSTPITTAVLNVFASHGSVTKDPDLSPYPLGTDVTLTPVADSGYVFVDWSGDVPAGHATDNPLLVTMDHDRSLTARFESANLAAADNFNRPNETPLTLGGNWQRPFAGGTANLAGHQVAGAAGEALYYWQGPGAFDGSTQTASATVVAAGGQVGLVLLGASNQALVVSWSGGSVYVYWYAGGAYEGNLKTAPSAIQDGDIVEALLDGGTIYAKVNGTVVASVANTTTLSTGKPGFETFQAGGILDDWKAASAPLHAIRGTITENGEGLGGVLVTAGGGFTGSTTTGASGTFTLAGVPAGATGIVLTPTLSGHTLNPLTRTVAGPMTADVADVDFTSIAKDSVSLTVQAAHGSVTRDPDESTFVVWTDVTLTPHPDAGYVFVSWSGDVPAGHETDNPLALTMDKDRSLTARFEIPNLVASDDFNRANETPLFLGGNWQRPFTGGTASLLSQQVTGATGEALYYWQGPETFDDTLQFARARVVQAGGQVGLVLLGASNQALVTSWSGGSVYIYWYSGGQYQGNLKTAPSTLHDGDLIDAQLDGGTVQAIVNGVVVASVANTTTLTTGRPGFETYLTGGTLDDWKAGSLASALPSEITASATPGGSITPNGVVSVTRGASQSFTVTADTGYYLDSLVVDGTAVPLGGSYTFNIVQTNHTIHAVFLVYDPSLAGVDGGPPTAFALSPVWPNPARGFTRFQIALPREANVHVGLHDVQGRELQVLANGVLPAGRHSLEWSQARGVALMPGLYFVRMSTAGHTIVRRFVLVK